MASPLQSDLQRACEKYFAAFLNQKHSRYSAYRVPNGGLCGPTCVIDILTAYEVREGNLPPNRGGIFSQLHRYHGALSPRYQGASHDLRYGTKSNDGFPEAIEHVFAYLGHPNVTAELKPLGRGRNIAAEFARPDRPDSIAMLPVHRYYPNRAPSERWGSGHWLVVTKVDPEKRLLWYRDPNKEELHVMGYEENPHDGSIKLLRHNLGYFQKDAPEIRADEILTIDLNSALPRRTFTSAQSVADHLARLARDTSGKSLFEFLYGILIRPEGDGFRYAGIAVSQQVLREGVLEFSRTKNLPEQVAEMLAIILKDNREELGLAK